MKNILMCCNSMGIGGVETVILNQVVTFSKRGYNVYVIAKNGEYSSKVREFGGTFIEVDFPEENNIDKDRVETIKNIIKKNGITEIHIHKYQCIPSVLVAALATNTPYFAYEHGIVDSKKYYTWNYPIYKFLFPIYYKNAYKIVAITQKVADITKNEFGFSHDKYAIVHNGIDFDIFKNESPNYDNKIQNVLLISRLDKDKLPTIYNGIQAYKSLKDIYPDAKLNIVGGGNAEQDIIEYLNKEELEYTYNDDNVPVKLLGKQTDVKKYLVQNDILLGVGRCILEAIAMRLPAIITGYDGINGLVTEDNMDLAMEENFSGFNMDTISTEKLKEQILNLQDNRKKNIDKVYERAEEKLNCHKNYINIPETETLHVDWSSIFEILQEDSNLIEKQYKDVKDKNDWIQKVEEQNRNALSEIEELEKKYNQAKILIEQNKQKPSIKGRIWNFAKKIIKALGKNNK